MDRYQFILALMDTAGIGDRLTSCILRRNAVLRREPADFAALSPSAIADEYGLNPEVATALDQKLHSKPEPITSIANRLAGAGISMISVVDASYPHRLTERIAQPPPVLFVYGNTSLLERRNLAVANSNGAPEDALALGDRAVEAAATGRWSVVTGHNRVEYQRPALAAKRNGIGICYVLDRGIIEGFGGDLSRDLFPAARIWGPAYDPQTDLTISTFSPLAHGHLAGNRKRDNLIFALADTIIAPYIKSGGNMGKNCRMALGRGVDVWLSPNEIGDTAELETAGAKRLPGASLQEIRQALE